MGGLLHIHVYVCTSSSVFMSRVDYGFCDEICVKILVKCMKLYWQSICLYIVTFEP